METSPTTKVTKPAKSAVSSLTLGSADDALTLANELQKFVQKNNLTSNIQGKAFPNVERKPLELLASIRRHCFHEWMQITFGPWDWAAYEARNDVWDLMDTLTSQQEQAPQS